MQTPETLQSISPKTVFKRKCFKMMRGVNDVQKKWKFMA